MEKTFDIWSGAIETNHDNVTESVTIDYAATIVDDYIKPLPPSGGSGSGGH